MGVSKNNGTPKSSIGIGFSIILCIGLYCQRSVFQQQAKRISTSSVRTPKHQDNSWHAPKMLFFVLHKLWLKDGELELFLEET